MLEKIVIHLWFEFVKCEDDNDNRENYLYHSGIIKVVSSRMGEPIPRPYASVGIVVCISKTVCAP